MRAVTGFPYSAIEVTETTAPSASGVGVTQQFRAKVCRDSDGRTRYEYIGIPESGVSPDTVRIDDPVSGATYVLFPRGRVAMKAEFGSVIPPGPYRRTVDASANPPSQNLGKKVIEGLQVDGTRRKTGFTGAPGSIPPGMGTAEEWYSPALCVVVMRVYESSPSYKRVVRLTEIVRGEPSAELIRVPADYTVQVRPTPHRD